MQGCPISKMGPQPRKAYYAYAVGDAGEGNAAGGILMVAQGQKRLDFAEKQV